MISIQNLNKSFGDQAIFSNASFSLNSGEKIGLIGRNGSGKSTLLKILIGQEHIDDGKLSFPKGYKIGYLKQEYSPTKLTVLEEALKNTAPDEQEEWRMKKLLAGLGFSEQQVQLPPLNFSSGFQMRIALAALLYSKPQCLLLDEPTNFLDMPSIQWLSSYLRSWTGEIIIISHDRTFLDTVITHTAGIRHCQIKRMKGQTKQYLEQIKMEEIILEKEQSNQEKKTKKIEEFISKFRAKARQANLAQSRIKALNKQKVIEVPRKESNLFFTFPFVSSPHKYSLEFRDLSFTYPNTEKAIFSLLSTTIMKNDKVGIIGRNGKGKSTLLRVLANKLKPYEGKLTYHPKTTKSFFEQQAVEELHPENTVVESVLEEQEGLDKKKAMDICATMLFSQDRAEKKIKVLSGGEKCRVLFAKLLAKPSNLLLLDEPTHHLDLESIEALKNALIHFPGAFVLVTHNESLLHGLVNKLIVFNDDHVEILDETFEAFLSQGGFSPSTEKKEPKASLSSNLSHKERKKIKAIFIQKKSKTLQPLKNKANSIEKQIELLESEHHEAETSMIELSQGEFDSETMKNLAQQLPQYKKQIDELYGELDQVFIEIEEMEAQLSIEEKQLFST